MLLYLPTQYHRPDTGPPGNCHWDHRLFRKLPLAASNQLRCEGFVKGQERLSLRPTTLSPWGKDEVKVKVKAIPLQLNHYRSAMAKDDLDQRRRSDPPMLDAPIPEEIIANNRQRQSQKAHLHGARRPVSGVRQGLLMTA